MLTLVKSFDPNIKDEDVLNQAVAVKSRYSFELAAMLIFQEEIRKNPTDKIIGFAVDDDGIQLIWS